MGFLRRAISSSLLLIFSLTLLSPLLAAFTPAEESNLPACCRRDGKHQCAKRPAAVDTAGTAVSNAPTRCGHYRPAASLGAGAPAVAIPEAQSAVALPVAAAVPPPAHRGLAHRAVPAAPLRGPPSLTA